MLTESSLLGRRPAILDGSRTLWAGSKITALVTTAMSAHGGRGASLRCCRHFVPRAYFLARRLLTLAIPNLLRVTQHRLHGKRHKAGVDEGEGLPAAASLVRWCAPGEKG